MTARGKVFVGILLAVLVLVLIVIFTPRPNPANHQAPIGTDQASESNATPEYNEVIDPYELSKNPYKLKGHFGVLDTRHTPVVLSSGQRIRSALYPLGGGLKFNKMLDAHTALFDILILDGGAGFDPGGQIAVLLQDSNEPDPSRNWRVRVEEPIDAVNGFGATIQVPAVRFDGYYVEQNTPTSVPATSQASTVTSDSAPSSNGSSQSMPVELIGKWVVKKELPAPTISCMDQSASDKIIGTEIEFTADTFRWDTTITKHPSVRITRVTAEQFQSEHTGSESSVNFEQLGIGEGQATQVELSRPDAPNAAGGTSEIPIDAILIKDQNTIVFSDCNVYFEAQRRQP